MRKNVRRKHALLIAYQFPPVGGMSPKIARNYVAALAGDGYDVDVVTPAASPDHPVYRIDHSSQGHDCIEGVTLHRTYPGPLYRLACRAARKPRVAATPATPANADAARAAYRRLIRPWMIPDGRADWLPWAIAKATSLILRRPYDLLVTYAFPYTCHFVGFALRPWIRGPWILNQGDLWSFSPGVNLPRWRLAIDRMLERAVLIRGTRIIVTNDEMIAGYREHFPEVPESRFAVIPIGYDRQTYERSAPEISARFRFAYTGALPVYGRGLYTFLEGLARARREESIDAECVIAGTMPQEIRDFASRLGLGDAVEFRGFQPSSAVAALQLGAHVLVMVGMPKGLQVPSKVYEYFAAKRPILGVRCDEADIAARSVSRHNRGLSVPDDVGEVERAIASLHKMWKSGSLDRSFDLAGVPAHDWDEVGRRFLAAVQEAERAWHA